MLQPAGPRPTAVDAAEQFPAAWLLVALLSVCGTLCWIGGIPSAIRLAPNRGGVLALIGGTITGAGLAAGIGHLALYFGFSSAVAASGVNDDAREALSTAGDGDALGNLLLVVFLVAFSLGPVILTIGLRIAGAVPVWVPVAALVTAGASFFGGPVAGIVQLVSLVLVWAPMAVAILRPQPAALGVSKAGAAAMS